MKVSWEQIQEDTEILVSKIKSSNMRFNAIVAISRGGLVPAAIIAHKLGIKVIDTISLCGYNDDYSPDEKLINVKPSLTLINTNHVLVIDDLVDSGRTTTAIRKINRLATVVAVYCKTSKVSNVDFYGKIIDDNGDWMVFPWES